MRDGPAFFVGAGIACLLLLPAPVSAQRSHDPCAAEKEREDSYPPIVLHDLKFDGKLTIPESGLHGKDHQRKRTIRLSPTKAIARRSEVKSVLRSEAFR
jgi:hypothetical protein